MSDKRIEPALTTEDWRDWDESDEFAGIEYSVQHFLSRRGIAGAIALLNSALPDNDPRKITREKVRALLEATDPDPCYFDHHGYCQAHGWLQPGGCPVPFARAFADALESYLPPEDGR